MPDSLQSSTGTGFSCTTQEDLIVFIFEVKVENLGGEVSDDIGQVTTPEGQYSLLLGDTNHAVYNALVLLICRDLLAGMLHLTDKEANKDELQPWRREKGKEYIVSTRLKRLASSLHLVFYIVGPTVLTLRCCHRWMR